MGDADLSNILADLNSSAAWPARELEEASCSIHCYVDHCSECYNKGCSSGSLACWTLKKTPRGVYKCKPCYRNSGCSSASYDELEEAGESMYEYKNRYAPGISYLEAKCGYARFVKGTKPEPNNGFGVKRKRKYRMSFD